MMVEKDEAELQLELALAAQANNLADGYLNADDDEDDFGIAYDTETGTEIDMKPPFVKIAMVEKEYEVAVQQGAVRDAVRLLVSRAHLTQLVHGLCHPRLSQAYLTAAKGYMDLLGWYQQAFHHAREAQRIYKQLAQEGQKTEEIRKLATDVYYVLGVCLTQLDDLDQAEKLLQKALEKDSGKTGSGKGVSLRMTDAQRDIHHALAICKMKLEKYSEARESFALVKSALTKGAKEDPGKREQLVFVNRDIADCLMKEGNFDDSINDINAMVKQIEMNEGDESVTLCEWLMMIYNCHMANNNPFEAEPILRRVLDIQISSLGQMDKDTISTQDELIHFLMREERYEDASFLLKKTKEAKIELFGPISAQVADVYQSLGAISLALGDVSSAKKYLTAAIKRYTDARGKHNKKIREAKQLLNLVATPDDNNPHGRTLPRKRPSQRRTSSKRK